MTLASDIAISTESLISLSPHTESVWKELSNFLYEVGRNNRISGLTMLLPIFVFFVDDCRNIESAIEGSRDLANNRYYVAAMAANRRIVFCCDDIWDTKVNALEKDLSAGIASAAAMSSVAVSNVAKGEVSVGGGYGYYNSQSAVALGAAMGLTDNWSVNAAAGLSDSNITFRAGTNYKFKLF